jgi:hypothetical protein
MASSVPPQPGIAPTTLSRERLQLHYAARLLASVAHALLPHAEDDSHSNLGLSEDGSTLVTHWLDDVGRALTLHLRDLRLSWTLRGAERGTFTLPGSTMAEAYAWLNAARPKGTPEITERTFPDFPEHPLGEGARFVIGDPGRRVQLGRHFALGQQLMDRLATEAPTASPRRVWPHHFDLGTVVEFGGPRTSVGVGLSPGDASYNEPYFYVSAYPPPAPDARPAWSGSGHWHTAGFVSLVLTATEWQGQEGDQRAVTSRFLREAFALSKSLVT